MRKHTNIPQVTVKDWMVENGKGAGMLLISNIIPWNDNALTLVQEAGVDVQALSHWSSTEQMLVAIELTADQIFFLRIREDGEDTSYGAATFAMRESKLCLIREVKGLNILLPED